MEHDTEPEKSEDRELIEKQRRNHGIAPIHGGVMRGLYRVLGLKQLSAARRYTARRTAARNMDRAGVPRQTAKQIIGHKTDATYNRYRIVNEQDIREGMLRAKHYLSSEKIGHPSDRKEKSE
jgi:hypothetical protein